MTCHDYKFSPWRVQKDQRVVVGESTWRHLPKWDWAAKAAGKRRRVLVGVDVFEDWNGPMLDARGNVLDSDRSRRMTDACASNYDPLTMADVRRRLFAIIDATPNLDWLLVTKLPENVARLMPQYDGHHVSCEHDGIVPVRPNVCVVTNTENQERARPWSARADELWPTEGHYCDFAAFEEWIKSRPEGCELWDTLDVYQQVDLYSWFCNAADFGRAVVAETGETA